MAWTSPRRANVGDVYSVSWHNGEIRDNLNWVVRPLMAPLTSMTEWVNSSALHDLFEDAVTIPGGTLGSKGMLRGTVVGDYKNNSAATRKLTIGIKVGSDLWYDETTDLPAATAWHDWTLEFLLAVKGAEVFLTGTWHYSTAGGATAGIGDLSNVTPGAGGPTIIPFGSNGLLTIDMSIDQPLVVFVQHSAAHANLSIRPRYAIFELVGQAAT